MVSAIKLPFLWLGVVIFLCNKLKGVMTRSMVNAFSELCSPFFKGGNSAFITAIASGLFSTNRISITRITTAQMAQIELKWDLITKT